jgi:hypothetical protein
LAYRFWAFQIGTLDLERYSGMKDLSFELESIKEKDPDIFRDLSIYHQQLKDHYEELTNLKIKEKVRVVENASFDDFLTNRRASVTLDDLIIKIPEVGEIKLLQVRFIRFKGIVMSGEVDQSSVEKVLKTFRTFPIDFTSFIKMNDYNITIEHCQVESLSGNPPPIIKIKIGRIQKIRIE